MTERAAISALATLADASLRTTILAMCVAAAVVFVRRATSTGKLQVWRGVLAAAIAMPVVAPLMPRVAVEMPVVRTGLERMVVLGSFETASQVPAGGELPGAASVSFAQTASDVGISETTAAALLLACYAIGVAFLVGRMLVGLFVTKRFVRRSNPIKAQSVLTRLETLAARIKLLHVPAIRESDAALVPLTMSVIRPVVVLPGDWQSWPPARLDSVLVHELAHIARRDLLTQHLSLIYRALTWFNPFSWWLQRQLCELGEHASDEAALASGASPVEYASTLVEFLSVVRDEPRRAHWEVAMASRGDRAARRRLDGVLNWTGNATGRARLVTVALMTLSLPAALLAASIEPARAQNVVSVPVPAPDSSTSIPVAAPAPGRTIVLPAMPPGSVELRDPRDPAAWREYILRQSELLRQRADRGEDLLNPSPTPSPTPSPSAAPVSPAPGPTPAPEPQVNPAATPVPVPAEQLAFRSFKSMSDEEFLKGLVVQDPKAPGYEAPKTLLQSPGRYTQAAMQNKVQGSVRVELIVLPSGTVGRSRIIGVAWTIGNQTFRSIDGNGLGLEALDAVNKWKFTPATLNGTPVTSVISTDLSFRIF